VGTFIRIRPDFLGAQFLKFGFGFFRTVPEIGLLGNEFFVFYFNDLTIVVKDTSSKPLFWPSSLSTVLLSSGFTLNEAQI
jgi:hypothetical protein